MSAVIIIPARMGATRLPGKPLIDIAGKPLVQWVFEAARQARRAARVIVATDDERIAAVVRGFGGEAQMTRAEHSSGTERIAEVAASLDARVIVNVQGDEPEMAPQTIDELIRIQSEYQPFASTMAAPFPDGLDVANPAAVKLALGGEVGPGVRRAVYFSRAPIPFRRDASALVERRLHLGIYAFGPASLQRFAGAPPGRLERVEVLEQLRILEMGETILVGEALTASSGIDTPDDLAAVRIRLAGAPGGA